MNVVPCLHNIERVNVIRNWHSFVPSWKKEVEHFKDRELYLYLTFNSSEKLRNEAKECLLSRKMVEN